MSKYNKKLNRQRQQIRKSGRKDMGYKAKHRNGCGLVLIIGGLTLMVISIFTISQVIA